ncbi:uncharacterized protein LOC141527809 [Cotesia typhae]|uniref:uncharacterized protein LOC141527809 n=1 Tax=Cotesia typhae TaxID=2053667 RepID=UPI003D69C53E
MDLKYLGIFVVILVVDSSVAEINPTLVMIRWKKLEGTIIDNSYFGYIATEILDSGELGSIKFSLKKPLPDNAKISVTVELDGIQISDYENSVCETMKYEVYRDNTLKYGLPKGKFPAECPITPGNFEISKYPIQKCEFLASTPPGNYNAKMAIGEPDQEPWVVVDIVIEISHAVPGVPVPRLIG